ncbi:hypothetical protein ACQW02_04715 [Humitalea sp. 24SJ18S-53]|uniref:hypothetical protein n=1 Tax=Humitalea sp. 24SJ18S-53 TaxID=3422307 RepID=UPI003D66ABC9
MRRHILMLALLPLVAGCAAQGPAAGPQYTATLPPDAVVGAGDPTTAAILGSQAAFANTASLAGRPADAALAIAQLVYLAVEIPTGQRWIGLNPTAATQLPGAAAEARAAIGTAPSAAPQTVIDTLFATRRALMAGNRTAAEAALPPAVYPAGGAATLARLSALPPLPQAAVATTNLSTAVQQMNMFEQPRMGGGGRR